MRGGMGVGFRSDSDVLILNLGNVYFVILHRAV